MRRRHITIAVASVAVLGAGVAAGCGSQGVASPTPQTVVGPLPKSTTPKTAPGNPANGKTVFLGIGGCASCHRFTPAGSKGTIGPDLDKLAEYAQKAGTPIGPYTEGAIKSPPPAYVPPGYQNVMPTTFAQTLKPQQIADLVAFLTQKKS